MVTLISTAEYDTDFATQSIWERIHDSLNDDEGICYYNDTLVASNTGAFPDLIVY